MCGVVHVQPTNCDQPTTKPELQLASVRTKRTFGSYYHCVCMMMVRMMISGPGILVYTLLVIFVLNTVFAKKTRSAHQKEPQPRHVEWPAWKTSTKAA